MMNSAQKSQLPEAVSAHVHDSASELQKEETSHSPSTEAVASVPPKKPLTFVLRGTEGRARCATVQLPHGNVQTPIFMAVGTHGTVKGVTPEELEDIGYQIILGNTYHLGNRPGAQLLNQNQGLHPYMQWKRNLLTDSGGFQMVSLLKLAEVTEEGVAFNSPVDGSRLLLTPEVSIEVQNAIGADIMMALDDVVSSTLPSRERVAEATARTTRWLDRCIAAHKYPSRQNIFGIVQGGLHEDLRLQSLQALKCRDTPGYAIGGLSGGEAKEDFWRIVELCTRDSVGLPVHKPRYLMGVGYPLDLLVCVALGVDMFDCVYPSRTARFGTALVPEGTLRLKSNKCKFDFSPLQEDCPCEACQRYTRSFLHHTVTKETTSTRLLTLHNLTYMFTFCRDMRNAILEKRFSSYVIEFLKKQFHSGLKSSFAYRCPWCTSERMATATAEVAAAVVCDAEVAPCPPTWVREALRSAGIPIDVYYDWDRSAVLARVQTKRKYDTSLFEGPVNATYPKKLKAARPEDTGSSDPRVI